MTSPRATISHSGLVVGGGGGGLNMAFGCFSLEDILSNIDIYDVYCGIRTYVRDRGSAR